MYDVNSFLHKNTALPFSVVDGLLFYFRYNREMAIDSGQFQGERRVSPEEEIRELERKLAEKKRELAAGAASPAEEKEVFREVVREHIEAMKPAMPPDGAPPVSHIPPKPPAAPADAAKAAEREEKLRLFIEYALTRGIADAAAKARAESPYLIDELHDRLVDEYYDKLVALRRIDPL